MSVIWSGNGDRIDLIVELGEHFPIVLEGGGTGELLGPGIDFSMLIIDVT